MNTKKKLIAIVAVVLVAIGGVAAVAYIISTEDKASPRPEDTTVIPGVERDKHLGTVKIVSRDIVQAAFGADATVANPQESGTVTIGSTKSETATFPVKTPQGEVVFEVDVRTYPSKTELNQAGPFVGAEVEKVAGIGEEAHYLVPYQQGFLEEQQVALITTKGRTSYKFALVQKSDNLLYDTAAAKAIVLEIAKQANLNEVK